jgi:Ca2+:H+ antiporter
VILTVPIMETLALYSGRPIRKAMTPLQASVVPITIIVTAINLKDGAINTAEGITHFVLFATFVMLLLIVL